MGSSGKWIWVLVGMTTLSVIGLFSCTQRSLDGMIIITTVDREETGPDFVPTLHIGEGPQSYLAAIHPDNTEQSPIELTDQFYSARCPDISYDGLHLVFSGRETIDDNWQVFEMDLKSLDYKQLTTSEADCSEPLYLPGGGIMYSESVKEAAHNRSNVLKVIPKDNTPHQQITFGPVSHTGTSMLHDGRVITLSALSVDGNSNANLMVMRPDGTKEMLFYKSHDKGMSVTKARENEHGDIYIMESDGSGIKRLISVSYNDPTVQKVILDDHSVLDLSGWRPEGQDKILFCQKEERNETYGLFEMETNGDHNPQPVYSNDQLHVLDAVPVRERSVPKKIPSAVNMSAETGLLLCQDINFAMPHQAHLGKDSREAVKIEVLGQERSLGIVEAEADGSVYIKIKADMPFRLQTLDQQGNIVNGPSSWINLRPNERRACVGCHQGNEIAPENRQPLSVLKEPVIIPIPSELIAKTE